MRGKAGGWLFDVESLRQITFSQTEFYRSRGIFYTRGERKNTKVHKYIYIYIYVYKARRVGSKYKYTYICATRSDQFHRVEKKTRVERFNTIRIELVG